MSVATETDRQHVIVGVQQLAHAPKTLPTYQTPGSAAMDVAAALSEPLTLSPMQRCLIPTGLILEIPHGYECQLRARSGLSIKHGITLVNGIGTIDSDYRDELKVAVINLSQDTYTIQPGDRIAQLLVAPVSQLEWKPVEKAAAVNGREGGFGSTGLN